MKGERYTEEFKVEAVKQVNERGYSIAEAAKRLGVTTKSLYTWVARYRDKAPQQKQRTVLDWFQGE